RAPTAPFAVVRAQPELMLVIEQEGRGAAAPTIRSFGIETIRLAGTLVVDKRDADLVWPSRLLEHFGLLDHGDEPRLRGLARAVGHSFDSLRLAGDLGELGQGKGCRIDPVDPAVLKAGQDLMVLSLAQTGDWRRPEPLPGEFERCQVESQQVARI